MNEGVDVGVYVGVSVSVGVEVDVKEGVEVKVIMIGEVAEDVEVRMAVGGINKSPGLQLESKKITPNKIIRIFRSIILFSLNEFRILSKQT